MATLTEETYEAIKRDIIRCELRPGERVVQSDVAERYDTSTTPVRDALHRLAREKLVQPVPRVGYVIAPVTVQDVRELFELRRILEIGSCRWSASRGSKEILADIRERAEFAYVYGDTASYSKFLAQNVNSHQTSACAAANQRHVDQLTDVREALQRVFHLGLSLSRRDNAAVVRQGQPGGADQSRWQALWLRLSAIA